MNERVDLVTRVAAHLAEAAGGSVQGLRVVPLGGGACQDNYRVEGTFTGGQLDGVGRLVLRSDAGRSLPGSIDRRVEHAVVGTAVGRGVRTPRARFFSTGLVRDGAHAYFLDWAEGDAIGRKVLRDPTLAQARLGLAEELGGELVKIHGITPQNAPDLATLLPVPPEGDPALAALAFARRMLDALPVPSPALELAMVWLVENRPKDPGFVLVHGDFRTGNFMVTPAGLSAILDWEFARWGAEEEDIAWICLRNWRFGELGRPVGGFADRASLYGAYERAGGRPVDPERVRFWEVMGNVRWAAGCVLQGERYLSGADEDIELIAIPRHAAEMELEALRLTEESHA